MYLGYLLLLTLSSIIPQSAAALDLADSHFNDYKGLSNLIGVHKIESTKETPPSSTTQTWYLNIYDSSAKDANKELKIADCPADSQICGLTSVKLPNSDALTTEIFSFSNKLNPQYEIGNDTITVSLTGSNWGSNSLDSEIRLICNEDIGENLDGLQLTNSFDYSKLQLSWESKYCCASTDSPDDDKKSKPNKGKPNGDDDDDDSSSWGFFTWLFISLVLIFAGYIVGQAWINTSSMGSSGEFFNALVDSIVETCSKIPELLREIITKITGGGSRGGYSAV